MAVAGPLNPPGGAVSSTYKTLTEVEPRIAINSTNTPGDATSSYKITQPGSYYFTGDLAGAASKNGILIAASDVSIDLNGFTLRGVSGSTNAIAMDTARSNIAVRNGSITNWGFSAVNVYNGSGSGYVIEDVRAVSCGGQNFLFGRNARVSRCIVESAGSYGIYAVGGKCVIESCVVRGAGFYGIVVIDNSIVRDCSASAVTGTGILASGTCVVSDCTAVGCTTGIYVESASTAVDCVASGNSSEGFFVNLSSVLRGCVASTNTVGVHVFGGDNRIESNTFNTNARGLKVDSAGNIITRNVASGNSTLNWDVVAGNVCLVVNATTGGAISGNSGGAAPGSTDPSANFTY
ncbi:MAG: right-handed parallel beta-helix repeat-containing protein [Phycisphaerales bacterium]